MIQVSKLYFNYPKRERVLEDVNLNIEEGDFVGIVGPSGSGKSTLSLTFNGIIPKSISGNLKGDVVVCGLNTREHEVYELAPKVGIVLQNPEAQLFGMTVEEELAFGPENLGIDVLEIERRIQKALEIVKIHDRERFPFSLSGGEKQRVAIASMLTMLPKVLVLDEPTSQLDPLGKSEVFFLLKNLKKITIVLIEHETEFLATYAKKILVLESGRILRSGTPQEIFSQVKFCEKIGIKVPDVAKFTYRLSELGILDGVCVEFQEALEKCKFLRRRKVLEDEKFKLLSLRKPQVKIEDLSFKYPESEDFALRNVNLEIGRGEALAIIGENGSGKTTLAKHLNGLLKPTSGRVFIDDKKTISFSVAELSRIVGFVFQNPEHQIFADTVYEEVEFGLKNLQVEKEERRKRILEVLERTDLLRYRDSHPLTLSGGEKQRLAIASILVMQPQILVLDEPTNGLDLRSAKQITTLVEELQRTGHTIILITHEMDLVAKIAKRVVVLKEGLIVADGPLKKIFNDEELLKQNSLKEPQITRLSKALGYGISTTVEELLEKVIR